MTFVNAVCFAQAFSQCDFFLGWWFLNKIKQILPEFVAKPPISHKVPYLETWHIPILKKACSMLESRIYPWLHLFGGWGCGAWTSGNRLGNPTQPIQEGNDSNFLSEKLIEPLIEAPRDSTWKHTPWWTKKGKENPPDLPKKGGGENEDPILVILGEGIYTPQIAPPTFHQRKIQNEGFMLKCCWFLLASKLADCICITVLRLMVSNRCFLVILRWLGRCVTSLFFLTKMPEFWLPIQRKNWLAFGSLLDDGQGYPSNIFHMFILRLCWVSLYLSISFTRFKWYTPVTKWNKTHLCMSRCACYWENFSWKCWLAEQYRHLWALAVLPI